jgi:hypothetical protein
MAISKDLEKAIEDYRAQLALHKEIEQNHERAGQRMSEGFESFREAWTAFLNGADGDALRQANVRRDQDEDFRTAIRKALVASDKELSRLYNVMFELIMGDKT